MATDEDIEKQRNQESEKRKMAKKHSAKGECVHYSTMKYIRMKWEKQRTSFYRESRCTVSNSRYTLTARNGVVL